MTLAMTLALFGCRRGAAPTAPAEEEEQTEGALLPGARDAGPAPACSLAGRHAVLAARGGDAGEGVGARAEALSTVVTRAGRRTVWVDARAGRINLGAEPGVVATRALTPGERSDPAVAAFGPTRTPVVAWAFDATSGREHVVRVGERLERGCRGAETRDEGLSIAAVGTARGVLVAWDEEGPRPAAGSIKLQLIPEGSVGVSERDDALPRCPAARQVSAPEQDASDPVLVSTPDGAAVAVWLTSRDVDATQANDTVTDLWAQALDAGGASVGGALRLTNAVGHRFGATATAADGSTVWVAFRVADETDTESRGDGGDVVVIRVERRAGEGLIRASDPLTVTA